MRKDEPTLPRRRAFVVQLRGDADLDRGDVRGRIEHLLSGDVVHFESWEELRRFIAQVLGSVTPAGTVAQSTSERK